MTLHELLSHDQQLVAALFADEDYGATRALLFTENSNG